MYKKILIFILVLNVIVLFASCKEVTDEPVSAKEDTSSYITVDFTSRNPENYDPNPVNDSNNNLTITDNNSSDDGNTSTSESNSAQEPGSPINSKAATSVDPYIATLEHNVITLNKSRLKIKVDNIDVPLLVDIDNVKEKIPGFPQFSERASTLYEGYDRTYNYNDYVISTIPIDGKDIINQIEVKSGSYTTNEGVGIGSTFEEVKSIYGEDFIKTGTIYTYNCETTDIKDRPCLYFKIEQGRVTGFSYYNNRVPK